MKGRRQKEQREKVDYCTVWLKASADSMRCSEELSQIRAKVWAFTLFIGDRLPQEEDMALGDETFLIEIIPKGTNNWGLSAHTTSSVVTEYVLYSQRGKYSIHYTAQNYSYLEQWALISCILLCRFSRILLN